MSCCRETECTRCFHKDICCYKDKFIALLNDLTNDYEYNNINTDSIKCKYRVEKEEALKDKIEVKRSGRYPWGSSQTQLNENSEKENINLEDYNGKPIVLRDMDDRIWLAYKCEFIPNKENPCLNMLRIYTFDRSISSLFFYKDDIKYISLWHEGEKMYNDMKEKAVAKTVERILGGKENDN